ncbi:peptidylprolyl isomerase, partial [Dokdonella sp.]|uniref:peptidylprolyl isomerase n=1 Tax=Dokdonella sp. TaxID=2291710 RepID=UPI003C3541D6
DLPPSIRDAVSGLKPGRISEVVENDGAVMVFRCEDIKDGATPTADEVRSKLRANLLQIRKGEIEQSFGEHLLDSANVEITPQSADIVLRVGDHELDAEALEVLMGIKVPGSTPADWDDGARQKLLRNWAIGVLEERLAIERAIDKSASVAQALRWHQMQVLARNELVRRIDKELEPPSEKAMRSYYAQNARRYRVPEKFTLDMISFGRVPSNDDEAAGKLIELAERVETRIASGELSFADAARRYSQAPSAARAGEPRIMTRPQIGALGSVAGKAVAELAPGQRTGLLRLRSGLWMFELHDRQPARAKDFSEAKGAIRKEMRKREVERLEMLIREQQWNQLEIHILSGPDSRVSENS